MARLKSVAPSLAAALDLHVNRMCFMFAHSAGAPGGQKDVRFISIIQFISIIP